MINNEIEMSNENYHSNRSDQYLTFCIEKENFGIDINSVMEIKAWSKPTRLPNASEYVIGVLNVRGLILPIFDLKMRFGMGKVNANSKSVVIFVNYKDSMLGMLVDGVSDIITAPKSSMKPAPKVSGAIKDEFIKGLIDINDKMFTLLDIAKIFEKTDFNVPSVN